jgi:hypothetical protein
MSDREVIIEIENPSTKSKKMFKSKKKNNKEVIEELTTEEANTIRMESAFGLSQNNMSKRLQKEIQEAVDETYKSFKSSIKDTILKSLGFEKDRWGGQKWEVDHCNGRMSSVTENISHMARSWFKEIGAEEFCESLLKTEKQELLKQIEKEVKQQSKIIVQNYLRTAVANSIHEAIKTATEEAVKAEIELYKQTVVETVKEQFDSVISDNITNKQ